MIDDDPRWQRIILVLELFSPREARWLTDKLEAPWQRRRRRLDARDDAVRAAAALVSTGGPYAASKAVAAAYGRYLAGLWPRDQIQPPSDDAPPARIALYRLARANEASPLGERQIQNILAGGPSR